MNRRVRSRLIWSGCLIVVSSIMMLASRQAVAVSASELQVPERESADEQHIQFNRDVRPILSDKCFACHGFDPSHREADLRLDIPPPEPEGWEGWVIVPGDLDASELWQRVITDDEDLRMPPVDTHKTLSANERDVLRTWILQGAVFEGHWAFEPIPHEVEVPSGGDLHPVDAFIRDRMQHAGMSPSPEADKATLIRRLSFTLNGLPPTHQEVADFLADESPDAYERVVDCYLESPHFGEEMARHWLDVARYADTHGMHLDNERQMWAYRDWVIAAFNRNLPFDEFTIQQVAGDLLPNPSQDQLVATGFNRCNVTTGEGGSIDAEYLFRYAVERASTTAETWLGLTAGCAVCHDHKFDPISHEEFYSLYAFFYSAADPAMDGNALLTEPVLRLETDEHRARIAEYQAQIAAAQQAVLQQAAEVSYTDPASMDPPPQAEVVKRVWVDDAFPEGGTVTASPGHPTRFVTEIGEDQPVFRGQKAVQRSDAGLAQDVWETSTDPLTLPPQGKFFAHVYLDPQDPPTSIMVQFNKGGWKHRGVWGDYDVIDWGAAGTHERVNMGALPELGAWVRLEFSVDVVGLAAGDSLSGFALTQHGGTVYWDYVGVEGLVDRANDPAHSLIAWWRKAMTHDWPGLPEDLVAVAKAGPDQTDVPPEKLQRLRAHYLAQHCVDTKEVFAESQQAVADLTQQLQDFQASIPSTFIFRDLPQPRQAHVMLRGQYDQPGQPVQPQVPAALPPLTIQDEDRRPNRLDLARWLVSPEQPLTARVAVNRFWQQIFGVGLVKTSADFGSQGEPPSHPELLDFLANDFRTSGWDVKALIRMLVTSETFRQSAQITPEAWERDPDNRLLARMSRLRLDAEQIRDNALFVSGLINLEMGGPGVKPYQPPNIWEPVGFAGSNTRFYKQDSGDALYRRSIYTFLKRTAPPPFMSNFDAPNREQACSRRERSNTPLQALQLMNDVQHIEAARALAIRMLGEGGDSLDERLGFGFFQVLARDPSQREVQILRAQFERHLARYREAPEHATRLLAIGESEVPESLDPIELAAYTLVSNTLLNLDETLNRN